MKSTKSVWRHRLYIWTVVVMVCQIQHWITLRCNNTISKRFVRLPHQHHQHRRRRRRPHPTMRTFGWHLCNIASKHKQRLQWPQLLLPKLTSTTSIISSSNINSNTSTRPQIHHFRFNGTHQQLPHAPNWSTFTASKATMPLCPSTVKVNFTHHFLAFPF